MCDDSRLVRGLVNEGVDIVRTVAGIGPDRGATPPLPHHPGIGREGGGRLHNCQEIFTFREPVTRPYVRLG